MIIRAQIFVAILAVTFSVLGTEIVAHRGASFDAPENTVASTKLGFEQRADGGECDVYLTKDGELMVMHDRDTLRTAGVKYDMSQSSSAELRNLEVGQWGEWKGKGFSEKIPFLEEVLGAVPARKKIVVHIASGPEILPKLQSVLAGSGKKHNQIVLICFNYEVVKQAKALMPQYQVLWLAAMDSKTREYPRVETLIEKAVAAKLDGLDLYFDFPIDKSFVQKVHAAGLKLYVWTVNDAQVARLLAEAGVDSITTDRSGWMREQIRVPSRSINLEQAFQIPPDIAKPWTYWFWINGNITKEGITADLEAMARVGIGGVLIMEVAAKKMAPPGPVAFASPEWRELFKHVVAESKRLGLQVNMNNDAGWCGSGGPWITPDISMQKLVSSKITVTGPQKLETVLPQPEVIRDYYRDVKVLGYPESPNGVRSGVSKEAIVDLSSKMDGNGKLVWNFPAGQWTILRVGVTTTGVMNRPPPASGQGLECDKFNPKAIKHHFSAFIDKLADDVGPDLGRVFTMTHIDSWEVGAQDWTPRMAKEFKTRRGYDLTPWLAVLSGNEIVGNPEQTERFRWDFRRTQSELTVEAYAAALKELANDRGLKLSIEAYNGKGFINPLTYGAVADVPMGEFWISGWGAWDLLTSRLMASVGHVHGKPIIGAESFTSWPERDTFSEHPYALKTTGDWAFCQGVNRFVFHRGVLHPWTNQVPGMSFGGFGWHIDRNQTWWEPGAAYMSYLARCQVLLQAGRFVGDVCRLVPEGEAHGDVPGLPALPNRYDPIPRGYDYDYISDEAFLRYVSVKEGRLTTPSGMSYALLQLPNARSLAPEVARKIRDLVKAGATVIGQSPLRSPSLRNFPMCDEHVQGLAEETWGDCDGARVKEHNLGKGRAIWGKPLTDVLKTVAGGPDLDFVIDPPLTDQAIESVTQGPGVPHPGEPTGRMATEGLNWIHRRDGKTEIYFLANPQHRTVNALCNFRVKGLQPELWDPMNGQTQKIPVFRENSQGIEVPIRFDPAGSLFVVFRHEIDKPTQVVKVTYNGRSLYDRDGSPTAPRLPEIWQDKDTAKAVIIGGEPGSYDLVYADGRERSVLIASTPAPIELRGPWTVKFQPGRGAPDHAQFETLTDWSAHPDSGIRYFSGTATYRAEFDWAGPVQNLRWTLDLGGVQVMARVKINGKDLGVLWKPPFASDVTKYLKPGRNVLEVEITNLWPNRLIGDEQFPDDCTPNGKWKAGSIPAWPEWLLKGEPRPEQRRITFTTWKYHTKDSPLLPSGLLGPVRVFAETKKGS